MEEVGRVRRRGPEKSGMLKLSEVISTTVLYSLGFVSKPFCETCYDYCSAVRIEWADIPTGLHLCLHVAASLSCHAKRKGRGSLSV